jgi:signal transduction histidine kinase
VRDLLRPVWDEPRPPGAPRRVWRDWALAVVLVPAAVAEGLLRPGLPWRAAVIGVVIALVPTLLWRRAHPLLMLALGGGVPGLLDAASGGRAGEPYTSGYLLVLLYAVTRWGSGREVLGGGAIVLAGTGFALAAGRGPAGEAAGGLVVAGAVLTLGAAVRYRAAARIRELERVALLERERIARDLHDTVAHHVSAIAIRAQVGLAEPQDGGATAALRVIEAEASRALAEMRAMVRLLRFGEPAGRDPGGLSSLESLAGDADHGPPVTVTIEGDRDGVAPAVAGALYRLAQEAITNARRHARHATRIDVSLVAGADAVELRVTDDGDAASSAGTGYGLAGMAERAALLGGFCTAGPRPGRGWTVAVTVPHAGAAA